MSPSILHTALTGFLSHLVPEMILGLAACVLFLGGTWRANRHLSGAFALLSLIAAAIALAVTFQTVPTIELARQQLSETPLDQQAAARQTIEATVYSSPVLFTYLAVFFKIVALVGGAVFVLFSWDEAGDQHASEYHGCLLLIVAGTCLCGAANDLVTLFLALELVSIPTYILLYLPRSDQPAQEAAVKYFMLSIFSSALLLFGFSYLYGVTGTTNLSAITDALVNAHKPFNAAEAEQKFALGSGSSWQGLVLVALVMVVAGLGFRITAVPFHFYAPDVYQGTTTGAAALLAFVPKVVGFAALLRVLGYVSITLSGAPNAQPLGDSATNLLWIMSAVTMSLGNILALLQNNLKRLLAYSSVAHAGYMLIGLAVAPRLAGAPGQAVGGVEALLFYLLAYGAMTVGAFAVLHYLSTPERPVENVDDLAGLSKSHPGTALVMVLFLFSLLGMPLTAGFMGKFFLFFDAMGLTSVAARADDAKQVADQARLYRILALIGSLNAAVGAWYYLRIAAVMYLREGIEPLPKPRPAPVQLAIAVCAVVTLWLGIYPAPVVKAMRAAIPRQAEAASDALPRFAEGPARQ